MQECKFIKAPIDRIEQEANKAMAEGWVSAGSPFRPSIAGPYWWPMVREQNAQALEVSSSSTTPGFSHVANEIYYDGELVAMARIGEIAICDDCPSNLKGPLSSYCKRNKLGKWADQDAESDN